MSDQPDDRNDVTSDDGLLRARLQAIDPVPPDAALLPLTSPRARDLLERAMTDTTTPTPISDGPIMVGPSKRRHLPLIGVAAAAVIAAAVAVPLALSGHDTSAPPAVAKPKTTLALTAQGAGASMQMCIQFSVDNLAKMSPAFAGTVTDVTPTEVTLDVDHWYTGGTADIVTISAPGADGTTLAEDGTSFTKGGRYLITATDGVVNGCGYSGPATPDFEKSFDEAFPSAAP